MFAKDDWRGAESRKRSRNEDADRHYLRCLPTAHESAEYRGERCRSRVCEKCFLTPDAASLCITCSIEGRHSTRASSAARSEAATHRFIRPHDGELADEQVSIDWKKMSKELSERVRELEGTVALKEKRIRDVEQSTRFLVTELNAKMASMREGESSSLETVTAFCTSNMEALRRIHKVDTIACHRIHSFPVFMADEGGSTCDDDVTEYKINWHLVSPGSGEEPKRFEGKFEVGSTGIVSYFVRCTSHKNVTACSVRILHPTESKKDYVTRSVYCQKVGVFEGNAHLMKVEDFCTFIFDKKLFLAVNDKGH